MKDYQAKNIRNLSIVGHGSEGKTTLVEALLFAAGAIDRQGRVEDGSTTTDHDAEEIKRQISISSAIAPVEFGGKKINVIDVPGYFDFAGEAAAALRVADTGILFCVVVGDGVAVGNFAETVNCTGCKQHAFGKSGLTVAAVTEETDVANVFRYVAHESFLLVSIVKVILIDELK